MMSAKLRLPVAAVGALFLVLAALIAVAAITGTPHPDPHISLDFLQISFAFHAVCGVLYLVAALDDRYIDLATRTSIVLLVMLGVIALISSVSNIGIVTAFAAQRAARYFLLAGVVRIAVVQAQVAQKAASRAAASELITQLRR